MSSACPVHIPVLCSYPFCARKYALTFLNVPVCVNFKYGIYSVLSVRIDCKAGYGKVSKSVYTCEVYIDEPLVSLSKNAHIYKISAHVKGPQVVMLNLLIFLQS